MAKLTISRERVNGFRLMTQALSPKLDDAKLALATAGWFPAREAAYFTMEARVQDFSREALDRLVFVERAFFEVGTVRGQSFLVSREMAPAALRCPCPSVKDRAERALAQAELEPTDPKEMRERVLGTLAEGPMTHRNLVEWYSRGEGRVSKLLADGPVLTAVLTLLRLEGRVARTNPQRTLDQGPSVYVPAASLLEGKEPAELETQDALRILCAYYFRVHGPATRADFGWWCGASQTESTEAFTAHRRNLTEVEIEGFPFRYFLPASRAEELAQHERSGAEPVVLAPFRDPWLTSHEGRAGRFLRNQDLHRIASGPALPAILVGGVVAGRWWIDTKAWEVRREWFRTPPEGVDEQVARRGLEIAAFAEREMANLSPLAVPGREGEIPVFE
ncbi:MAG: DNA glycosylase AlkZ-like family protein [Planctomycetota bacterium]